MSQPEISPLAKRLAEENNVDWHALQGSGPAGKVVERDVLEYLSRVMAGEEDINPTPEPTPDGMDSWPEEDIANYQQGNQQHSNSTPSTSSTHNDDMLVTDDLLTDDIDLLDGEDFGDDIAEDVFLLDDDDDINIDDDSSFVEQLNNNVDESGQALYGRGSRAASNTLTQGVAAMNDDLLSNDNLLSTDTLDETLDDDLLSEDFADDSFGDLSDTMDEPLDDFGDSDFGDSDFSDSDFASDTETDFTSMGNDLNDDGFSNNSLTDDFATEDFITDDLTNNLADNGFSIEDNNMSTGDAFVTDDALTADDSFTTDDALTADDAFTTDDAFTADGITETDNAMDVDDTLAVDDIFSMDTDDDTFASNDAFTLEDASSDAFTLEDASSDVTTTHDADLLAMDMDSTGSVHSHDVQTLSHIGTGDDISDALGLDDSDADLLAMDSDSLLDSTTESSNIDTSIDTEADHIHFDNTDVGEGAMPVAPNELRSDFDAFDSDSDHDHLGESLASRPLEDTLEDTLDDTFEDKLDDTDALMGAIDDTDSAFDDTSDSLDDAMSHVSSDAGLAMDDALGNSNDDVFASDDAVFSEVTSFDDNTLDDDTLDDNTLDDDTLEDTLDNALETDLSTDMPERHDMSNFAAAGAVAAGGTVAAASTGFHPSVAQQQQPATSFESNYQHDTSIAAPTSAPTAMQPAMTTTTSMHLAGGDGEGRNITLRRYLDLELFNELQEQIVAALGEEATVAMVQKAALKALEEVPLTGHNVNILDLAQNQVKIIPNAADMSLSGLVRAMHHTHEGASDMLVADLSRLEVDEIGMDVGVPLLTLGRILWSGEDGQNQSSIAMLALSGNVNPEMGSRFLAVAAEMLENPLLLLL